MKDHSLSAEIKEKIKLFKTFHDTIEIRCVIRHLEEALMSSCDTVSRPRFVMLVTKGGRKRVLPTSKIIEIWQQGDNCYAEIAGEPNPVSIKNFDNAAASLCR